MTVDFTLLVVIGDLASTQKNASKDMWDDTVWLLNNVAVHPDTNITYHTNEMYPHAYIDTSYHSVPNAWIRSEREWDQQQTQRWYSPTRVSHQWFHPRHKQSY